GVARQRGLHARGLVERGHERAGDPEIDVLLEHAARAVRAGVLAAMAGVDRDDTHALLALDRGDCGEPGILRATTARPHDVDDEAEWLANLARQGEDVETGRVRERELEPAAVRTRGDVDGI